MFLWCLVDAMIHSLTTRSLFQMQGSYLGRLSKCSFTHSQTPLHSILHVVMYPILKLVLEKYFTRLLNLVKHLQRQTGNAQKNCSGTMQCYKCTPWKQCLWPCAMIITFEILIWSSVKGKIKDRQGLEIICIAVTCTVPMTQNQIVFGLEVGTGDLIGHLAGDSSLELYEYQTYVPVPDAQ